jgi:hypothetical protein
MLAHVYSICWINNAWSCVLYLVDNKSWLMCTLINIVYPFRYSHVMYTQMFRRAHLQSRALHTINSE